MYKIYDIQKQLRITKTRPTRKQYTPILTADVIVRNMDSGIRPAFFRIRSSDPPSIYSIQILISPSLKAENRSAEPR
jgi:hypothetical protein